MYRGTTPKLIFNISTDIDLTKIDKCWITLQGEIGNKTRDYSLSDVEVDSEKHTITVQMSQEDTLYFNPGKINVQARIKIVDGDEEISYSSPIKEIFMKKILKDGEI